MASADSFFVEWSPRLLSVLRIIAAFLLIQHGAQKLFGVPAAPPPPAQQQAAQQSAQQQPAPQKPSGMPPMMLVAAVLEFFGGLLFLLGLFTRPVAFLLSGELAVAYFMAHAPRGFWPLLNQGELAALYSFLFLYFAVAGGGEWSVDRLWRRVRPARDAVA
jgi:putative oxidoreductase